MNNAASLEHSQSFFKSAFILHILISTLRSMEVPVVWGLSRLPNIATYWYMEDCLIGYMCQAFIDYFGIKSFIIGLCQTAIQDEGLRQSVEGPSN